MIPSNQRGNGAGRFRVTSITHNSYYITLIVGAGAVFLYKRSLLATLQGVDDDMDGIRISIPLQYVDSHKVTSYLDSLHTVKLSLSTPSTPGDDTSSTDSDKSIDAVEFVATAVHHCLDGLDEMMNAKQRLLEKEDLEEFAANRKIVVDYGSLGFPHTSEHSEESPNRSREQAICDAIGIGGSSDIWSTSILTVSLSSFGLLDGNSGASERVRSHCHLRILRRHA